MEFAKLSPVVHNMSMRRNREIRMALIFITHEVGLAYYVSDNIYITEHGKFAEISLPSDVILPPKEAYTR